MKIRLVVSDFHIGKGKVLPDGSFNYLEDFFYDRQFVEFMQYYRKGEFEKENVELVCNGDFFNHLHLDADEQDPDLLSERVALTRMEEIFKGHLEVFEEMKAFTQTPNHRVIFMLGNHDPGLLWPKVADFLKKKLASNVEVFLEPYVEGGVHIEHGHRFFADSAYDQKRLFLKEGLSEPIINLPWGCLFVIHYLGFVKKERPYFDKVYPVAHYIRWALIHDTTFALRSIANILLYFIGFRFVKDPSRRSPFWQTMKLLKEMAVAPDLERQAKKILLTRRDCHVVVCGHTHDYLIRHYSADKTYINTGLWNEKVNLDPPFLGRTVRLTYALIEWDERGKPIPLLKEWRGTYHITEDVYN
ncbi:MAG: metallophosphoesterase [Deltaproteobacteria bacterium]|nr:metallophosphoesterase [Deltaproteobacteria bacterium]